MSQTIYISKKLFSWLFIAGILLITNLKNNMKGAMMSVSDKILLRKRTINETVNDKLKNIAQVEYSRHRSFDNFISNMLGAIGHIASFRRNQISKSLEKLIISLLCSKQIRRTHVKHLSFLGKNIVFFFFWGIIASFRQINGKSSHTIILNLSIQTT